MPKDTSLPFEIVVLVTPHFNLATTTAFLDPFRAANYLTGDSRFRWCLVSMEGGAVTASDGIVVETAAQPAADGRPDLAVVSSSWTPERHSNRAMSKALQAWVRGGARIAALDTGAFLLAQAGLLRGRQATVHYEHIDALGELFPDVTVTEALFVADGPFLTCSGGMASVDLALAILRDVEGEGLANACARYLFHHQVRGPEATQNPHDQEPFGGAVPPVVRRAIDLMEQHLEAPLGIPEVCARLGVSQRHLARLFAAHVHRSPVQYYRDIRLDRARGLVTQTEMKLSEVAVAAGFSGQVQFSRAYRSRFGLPPQQDRIDGRVPFEFRAWPMHRPAST